MLSPVVPILIFGFSFTLGIGSLYLIRRFAVRWHFLAVPNSRTSHRKKIPNIGGLSFYLAVPLTMAAFYPLIDIDLPFMLAGLAMVIFLGMGLTDDKKHISAVVKLGFQALAVTLFLLGSGWRITGFFGLFELGSLVAFVYTLLFCLVVINALNMLDGIDGLAGMLGLVVLVFAGLFFYLAGPEYLVFFTISTAGLLLAFLRFNFSKRHKMLMGDTGSLWTGFVLAMILVYGFSETPVPGKGSFIQASYFDPYMFISLAAVPLFDFFRIFFLRLYRSYSPFRADRNHIHHILVDQLHLSHFRASVWIVVLNMSLFLITLLFAPHFSGLHYLIMYIVFFAVYSTGVHMLTVRLPKPTPSLKNQPKNA